LRNELGEIIGLCGIARDITERKLTEEALRDSEERYRALADAAFEAIFISEKGICTNTNQAATKMFGYKYDELIGIFGADVIAPESKELVKHNMLSGHEKPYEALAQRKDGTTFHTEIRGKMTRYKGKDVRITVVNDIEVRKRAEDTLRQAHDELEMKVEKRTYELVKTNERLKNEIKDHRRTELTLIARRRELENKTLELEEVNTALKVLLKQRDEDKKELEEKVIANVKTLVFPYIEKLNNSRLNNQQAVYLDIIKSNLEHVIAPFLHQLFSKYSDLTPKEIQIAGLVKDGKTTKEISEFLNSTTGAVDFHRNNLRKKLGLRNTKTNLRSFLLSFP
jgi:PAS domain S-box-containing protein